MTVLLFQKSQTVDVAAHGDLVQRIERVGESAARLQKQVLATRYGVLSHYDPLVATLQGLERGVARLSRDLPSQHVEPVRRAVVIDDGGVRLDAEVWREVWQVGTHLVRNAVDHGIEPADERAAAGKPKSGRIVLSARMRKGNLELSFSDDGRGIDWERVRAQAEDAGMPASSRQELVQALFSDGFSTRDEVTETSGRGVGTSAVVAAVRSMGGTVSLHSEPGLGTTVTLTFTAQQTPKRPADYEVVVKALSCPPHPTSAHAGAWQ